MSTEYNGFKNYETWNIALWINNDESIYNIALFATDYDDFVFEMQTTFESQYTPDQVAWDDRTLDFEKLTEVLEEL